MTRKFVALDGLRGVAAFAVAYSHARIVLAHDTAMENAAMAVDFFFMLSGFVLAHAYGRTLAEGHLKRYLAARVIRLFPLIALGTLAGAFSAVRSGDTLRLAIKGGLLIPETSGALMYPLDPPAWSLFYEMVASVLFGLGVWRFGLRSTVAIGATALLGVILGEKTLNVGFSFVDLPLGFARVFYAFGAGVALYRFRKRFKVPPMPLPVLAALLLAVLLYPAKSTPLLIVASYALFPLIVLSASNLETGLRAAAEWSGELSYPIYILHWPIYAAVAGQVSLWFGMTLATICALVVLVIFDQPVRAWLSSRFRERTRACATS